MRHAVAAVAVVFNPRLGWTRSVPARLARKVAHRVLERLDERRKGIDDRSRIE